jgi:hypothetical protein
MRYDETVNVILHHSRQYFLEKTIKSVVKISLHRHFNLCTPFRKVLVLAIEPRFRDCGIGFGAVYLGTDELII